MAEPSKKSSTRGNDALDLVISDDDEDESDDVTKGKSLNAKDGKLGFVTKRGFISATNFLVDILSQVYSEKYAIKGTAARLVSFMSQPI